MSADHLITPFSERYNDALLRHTQKLMSTKYKVTIEYKFTIEADSKEEAEKKALEKVEYAPDCPTDVFVRED